MAVTSTSASDTAIGWGTTTGVATGTNTDIIWGSATSDSANFGIAPQIAVDRKLYLPEDNIPRKHKDKNGCVKKSYWEARPMDIQDVAGISFNAGDTYEFQVNGTDAFTTSTQRINHTL